MLLPHVVSVLTHTPSVYVTAAARINAPLNHNYVFLFIFEAYLRVPGILPDITFNKHNTQFGRAYNPLIPTRSFFRNTPKMTECAKFVKLIVLRCLETSHSVALSENVKCKCPLLQAVCYQYGILQ